MNEEESKPQQVTLTLVDSKIMDQLIKLADGTQVSLDTQLAILGFTDKLAELQAQIDALASKIQSLNINVNNLKLSLDAEIMNMSDLRSRLGTVLANLEEYLRRHT